MFRELTSHEYEMVAGGDGFWNGFGEGLGGAVGEAFINWLMTPTDKQVLASRFQPEIGQTVVEEDAITKVKQADGEIWVDFNNDGVMDGLYWEDPADGDDRIDWIWDEANDVWKKAWIGAQGDFPTPTNVSEN